MYAPLYIKTNNSLLESMIKIEDLIEYAKVNNIKALTITDNRMYGVMEFYKACMANDIKPIIGLEITIDGSKIVLYAKSIKGYKNLIKLSTISTERTITIEDLTTYNSDLICILPYDSNNLYDTLKPLYEDIFKSYRTVKERETLSKDNLVYMNEILYIDKKDSEYLPYLWGIKDGIMVSNVKVDTKNNFVVNEDIIKKYFSEDLDNNKKIVDMCNLELGYTPDLLPKYKCPDNLDSFSYLKKLCIEGLKNIFGTSVSVIYKERLKYELDIINKMGFCNYFLVVWDFVKYAKEHDIYIGPGRGSAAGSLVSYCLNITTIDPIKYNLLFERFLNPERVTMPDIDIDFDASKRNIVIEYVVNKYGRENVSNIMTYSTLSSKQVLRDVSKCLEIDLKIVDKLCSYVEAKVCLKDNLNKNVNNMLEQYSNLKNAYFIAMKLEGLKRQIGTHAAGVVISSEKLTNLIPVIKGDTYLTGYTMEYLEELGLLKMDFLAIKDLSILSSIIKSIESLLGRKINIHSIPLDDKKTYQEFSNANTSGVFQFESAGMKNFLSKLKPNCFYDLVAALALFRPGPMGNIDTYILRKNGEKFDYIDKSLESILKPTYGIIIYQEQIMQILSKMANYSFANSDLIRRAISKKKLNIIEAEKSKFIDNSIKNGYSRNVAEEVYDLIVKFANYGFNKSHSVAYALVGYEMCFLKTHYPIYFYTSLLNYNMGSDIKTKEYLECLKKLNIDIVKPDINLSSNKYQVIDNKLLLPFNIIKNVGTNVSDLISSVRGDGFKDYFDFVKKVNLKSIGKKTIELLIMAGCLDSFNLTRKTMILNLDDAIDYSELSSGLDDSLITVPLIKKYDEYNNNELVNKEKELFGFYLSNHPIIKYNNKIKLIYINKYFDKIINICVYVEEIRKIKTKNNDDMAFLVCSDETCSTSFTVFPNKYYMIDDIKVGDIVMIVGKVEKRFDKYQILVNEIKKVEE